MSSADEFPNFLFQREYNKRWILYSLDELFIINKAVQKRQKTVSLPSNDPKKKIVINLEKMIHKNLSSGFEQNVRCLISSNEDLIYWAWQGDFNEWISYQPHTVFLLEAAFSGKMDKVDFTIKDDYEVNFQEFIQVNKETNYERRVLREIICVDCPKEYSENLVNLLDIDKSEHLLHKAADDISRYKNSLLGVPSSVRESSDNSEIDFSVVPERIMTALTAEASKPSTYAEDDITVAVDPECPKASNYVVYSECGEIYNATLNFTNLRDNNNKYFIIQLLKHNSKNAFAVWFHWGRVGYKGQCNLIDCGKNLEEAKSIFEKKFYDKTRNEWSMRFSFQRVPSKYDLVHVELASEASRPIPSAESKLDLRVQELLQIICNKKNLEEAAKEMCYDSNNTPLGKITARQIVEGYDALNEITNILKSKGKCKELIEANNIFYTKIPHDFGRKAPPLLCSVEQVKNKLKMLEDLSNICLAMDVLSSTGDGVENIIDKYYRSLDCNLIPLDPEGAKFKSLKECLELTHGPTHSTYTMDLVNAFECMKPAQESSFLDLENKRLLWHGSRISNWIGILQKGLQIAPPEAPSTGYMFGKGIYFADCSSKSANYCFATKKKNEGLLLLSEVSLGKPIVAVEADDLSDLPDGYHSVFGAGRIQPKEFMKNVLSAEATVPYGPLEDQLNEDLTLNYNEYIVYNVHQVKMKYLLRIRFNF